MLIKTVMPREQGMNLFSVIINRKKRKENRNNNPLSPPLNTPNVYSFIIHYVLCFVA